MFNFSLRAQNLPVIQCSQIVRCRSCRTYINPFVTFVDSKKWRCNLCYRVSECKFFDYLITTAMNCFSKYSDFCFVFAVPDEFQYDPVSKTYGDVTRRPEVKSSTIEFIAPSEYMVSHFQFFIFQHSWFRVYKWHLGLYFGSSGSQK